MNSMFFSAAATAATSPATPVVSTSDVGAALVAAAKLLLADFEHGRAIDVQPRRAAKRACLLHRLFPSVAVTRHDAAHIHDHLDAAVYPSVVLMNPPFSVSAHADRRVADAAFRHLSSALARLAEGGRLVAITGVRLSPGNPLWCDAFVRRQELARVVFLAAVHACVYARHGTRVATRVSVMDKVPADDRTVFPPSPGMTLYAAVLLDWVTRLVPTRPAVAAVPPVGRRKVAPIVRRAPAAAPLRRHLDRAAAVAASEPAGVDIAYETIDWMPADAGRITEALYDGYALQSIRISGSVSHPTRLVQPAAMAAVAQPKPSYRPHLPPNVITGGLLSDAELESVIYTVDRLKATGLISEIISWKLRLFVPTGAAGPEILAQLMERHPLIRVVHKAAA